MKRLKWKGVYVKPKNYDNSSNFLIQMSRSSVVVTKFIGQTFKIHTGKNFKEITVTKEMLYHKFGEFIRTRAEFTFKNKKKR